MPTLKGHLENHRSPIRKSLLAHAKPLHYWLSPGERGFHGEGHPIFRGAL